MTNRKPELNWTIPGPGETIDGKYVVEGKCGQGGLAVVLSAMHIGLDQRVAIKLLLPEWAGDKEVSERFVREGRAATSIRSEHGVRVSDVGILPGGAPYLVMEFLEGLNLDDVMVTWGPLPVPTAVDWILQAAEAIAEAHANGIVHRDLKPANLFLTRRPDGSSCIKVIDFGLSKKTDPNVPDLGRKLTQPNEVFGTPFYMAPEQLRASSDAGAPADLWALGAVLHELLIGQPPFHGNSIPEVCATVLTEAPPPLTSLRANVPAEVEAAVLRCLEKDPADRFASVAELASALAPWGTNEARESAARIERVLDEGTRLGGRRSDPSCPPMLLNPPWLEPEDPRTSYLVKPDKPKRWFPKAWLGGPLLLGASVSALVIWISSLTHAGARQTQRTETAHSMTAELRAPERAVRKDDGPAVEGLALSPTSPEIPIVAAPASSATQAPTTHASSDGVARRQSPPVNSRSTSQAVSSWRSRTAIQTEMPSALASPPIATANPTADSFPSASASATHETAAEPTAEDVFDGRR